MRELSRAERHAAIKRQVQRLLEQPYTRQLLGRKNFMVQTFATAELLRLVGRGRSLTWDELLKSGTAVARAAAGSVSIGIDSEKVSDFIARRMVDFFSSSVGG